MSGNNESLTTLKNRLLKENREVNDESLRQWAERHAEKLNSVPCAINFDADKVIEYALVDPDCWDAVLRMFPQTYFGCLGGPDDGLPVSNGGAEENDPVVIENRRTGCKAVYRWRDQQQRWVHDPDTLPEEVALWDENS